MKLKKRVEELETLVETLRPPWCAVPTCRQRAFNKSLTVTDVHEDGVTITVTLAPPDPVLCRVHLVDVLVSGLCS